MLELWDRWGLLGQAEARSCGMWNMEGGREGGYGAHQRVDEADRMDGLRRAGG